MCIVRSVADENIQIYFNCVFHILFGIAHQNDDDFIGDDNQNIACDNFSPLTCTALGIVCIGKRSCCLFRCESMHRNRHDCIGIIIVQGHRDWANGGTTMSPTQILMPIFRFWGLGDEFHPILHRAQFKLTPSKLVATPRQSTKELTIDSDRSATKHTSNEHHQSAHIVASTTKISSPTTLYLQCDTLFTHF